MQFKFKHAIYIGRFSPFHLGHQSTLKKGLELAEQVIMVLGSHNRAPDIKNPWTSEEREQMILSTLSDKEMERVRFVPMQDFLYNDTMWLYSAQNKIREATDDAEDNEICLIGLKSDSSSYYLDMFPRWQFIACPSDYDFHATNIRELYFTLDADYKKCVPVEVANWMEQWKKEPSFRSLKEEFEFIKEYKELWRGAPFAPTFLTCDCVVVKSGHILLVRRKGRPGKGLIALPGGFVMQNEFIQDAAIRELKEETSIKLSKEELKNAIVDQRVFDAPSRSNRGRTISVAYLLNLGLGTLPKVKGNDDADRSWWEPLNSAISRESEFFEDHYHMINFFLGRL
jgi:bifunctional NMN adenylyltransferase/nudix hydrolase